MKFRIKSGKLSRRIDGGLRILGVGDEVELSPEEVAQLPSSIKLIPVDGEVSGGTEVSGPVPPAEVVTENPVHHRPLPETPALQTEQAPAAPPATQAVQAHETPHAEGRVAQPAQAPAGDAAAGKLTEQAEAGKVRVEVLPAADEKKADEKPAAAPKLPKAEKAKKTTTKKKPAGR